ncbi:MAG: hypothetical protein ACP5S8_01555 [Hydrogenobaculum sp.]
MESVEGRLSEVEEMLKEFMAGMLMLEKSDKEMRKNIEALYESLKEEGKKIEELRESLKEEGKKIEELRESLKEEGKKISELKESIIELRKNSEESLKKQEKMVESLRETVEKSIKRMEMIEKRQDKEIKRFNKEWGALSNKLGTIVEDIIFPATRPVLESYFKCKITDLSLNRERIKDDLQDEFDVIAVSDECKTVFLIEVKSTPKIDYIDDFRTDKIERFRKLFDEYKDYKLVPIFASLRLQKNIINYLTKHKIYAMAFREWEYMDLLNFDSIKS